MKNPNHTRVVLWLMMKLPTKFDIQLFKVYVILPMLMFQVFCKLALYTPYKDQITTCIYLVLEGTWQAILLLL